MFKYIIVLILSTLAACQKAPQEQKVPQALEAKQAIRSILETQAEAWSNYDLESFMEGYWRSDSLKFFGAKGITYGWENTLKGYQKRYSSPDHTGSLRFKLESITQINASAYFVMGRFFLTRKVGDTQGIFTVIFKYIEGEWKIVADMSCA